ncbi:MAG: carbon storage regulator CsrA [Thermoanaerobacteraceae bacterium]|nr:carbon storage regulator CsrA [Thermoanaerobacteraceae bacterium]
MLVLTRKKGQGLVIGHGIRVVVVEVSGEYVRLGVEAPLQVPVFREEIYRALEEENRAALASGASLEGIKFLAAGSGRGPGRGGDGKA